MPVTYHLADRPVLDLLADVTRRHHPELHACGATVGVLMATHRDAGGEPTGQPAVKCHGAAALAKVKVNRLQDRIEGKPDATIVVDDLQFARLTPRQREAVLCHEALHLVPVEDRKGGGWKRDDLGRPVLKTRPDDFVLTGQYAVVELYGEDAVEAMSVRAVGERLRQLLLPGMGDEAGADDEAA